LQINERLLHGHSLNRPPPRGNRQLAPRRGPRGQAAALDSQDVGQFGLYCRSEVGSRLHIPQSITLKCERWIPLKNPLFLKISEDA
jgi:hypothetical protein